MFRDGRDVWVCCGGGDAGLSFCVLIQSEQGDEIRTKVRQGVHTHLRNAARKLGGGISPWERWVEVMCERRVAREKVTLVGCVGQEGYGHWCRICLGDEQSA